MQRFGTSKVGIFFGPVMVIWFAALAGLGIFNILHDPNILNKIQKEKKGTEVTLICTPIFKAFNPYYAFLFFKDNGLYGWETLGAVVLCITGCEAMYAGTSLLLSFPSSSLPTLSNLRVDMGHFGKNAVRISWLVVVFPSLILNYLGQV